MSGYITRRQFARGVGGIAGLIAAPHLSRAAFPERPLRIMVGFAAGGTVDTIARILAQAMTPLIGQQVVVENRPGASASRAVFRAEVARWTEVARRAGIAAQ